MAPGSSPTIGERFAHATITGRVQGVGYRAWTAGTAHRHGLRGWVRNRRDGSVEAVFAGSAEAVEAMLLECRGGPPSAHVISIVTEDWAEPVLAGFNLLPTA